MATPYSVPSIDDIIYSRSRVPSMEQITFNNLLKAIQNVQDAKGEREDREFTLLREENSRDFTRAQNEIIRTRADKAEEQRKKERKATIKREDEYRNQQRTDGLIERNLNLADEFMDEGRYIQAESALEVIENHLGETDSDWLTEVSLLQSGIEEGKREKTGTDNARKLARQYTMGKVSVEEIWGDENFLTHGSDAAWSTVVNAFARERSRRNVLEDVKIKTTIEDFKEQLSLAREDLKNVAALGDKEDIEAARVFVDVSKENLFTYINSLSPEAAKAKDEDPLSTQKIYELDEAIPLWIEHHKPLKMEIASNQNIATIKALVESGDLIPDYRHDGTIRNLVSRQGAPPRIIGELDPTKLPLPHEDVPTVEDLLDSLKTSFIAKNEAGVFSKGEGLQQKMSYNADIGKNPAVGKDSPVYVPQNVREYYGMTQEMYKNLSEASGTMRNVTWRLSLAEKNKNKQGRVGTEAKARLPQYKAIIKNAEKQRNWVVENLKTAAESLNMAIKDAANERDKKKLVNLRNNITRDLALASKPNWYQSHYKIYRTPVAGAAW